MKSYCPIGPLNAHTLNHEQTECIWCGPYGYPVPPSKTYVPLALEPLTIRREGDRDEPRHRTWIDNGWVTDEQLAKRHYYGSFDIVTNSGAPFEYVGRYICNCGMGKFVFSNISEDDLMRNRTKVMQNHEHLMREYKEGKAVSTRESIQARIARLDAAKADLEAEQLRLELLPKEPPACEDGTNSILFKVKFNNSFIYYTYVATSVNRETGTLWYISGPVYKNSGGLNWESLIEWITSQPKWEIWHVSGYDLLAASD